MGKLVEHHGRCEVKFLLEKYRALLQATAQRTPPTIREAQKRVREVVESDQRVEAVAMQFTCVNGQHVQLQSRVGPTFQYLPSPIQRKQNIVCKLEINQWEKTGITHPLNPNVWPLRLNVFLV